MKLKVILIKNLLLYFRNENIFKRKTLIVRLNMTARKKRGLGSIVTGGLSIVAGIVMFSNPVTPIILPLIFQAIGLLAGAYGVVVVTPDTD